MSSAHKKSKKSYSAKNVGLGGNSVAAKKIHHGPEEARVPHRYRSLSATGTRAMQKRHHIVR